MKQLFSNLVGAIFCLAQRCFIRRTTQKLYASIGHIGQGSAIAYPFNVMGEQNLFIDDDVSIGPNATIYCTRAKCIFGQHSFTGPNLTIITGDHAYWVGTPMKHCYKKLLDDISAYDSPVTIESDVWIGANVTILKGVTVGRGAIIAAGSLVLKDVKPYTIVGGVPAKTIKKKWDESQIRQHEQLLKDESKEISK